jgi:hypothetical protein
LTKLKVNRRGAFFVSGRLKSEILGCAPGWLTGTVQAKVGRSSSFRFPF